MITAKEAWKQSKYYGKYMDYMERVESEINKAVKKGLYLCEISIRNKTDNTAKDMLVEELGRLGYTVEEEEHKEWGDVEPSFYTLCISWKQELNAEGEGE